MGRARFCRWTIAGLAFITTMLAPAATLVVWTFLDVMRSGKATAVGAATAIVVGLVAITPAAAIGAVAFYSASMSFVLLKLVNLVLPIRAEASDGTEGLDVTLHGEEVYIHGSGVTAAAHVEAGTVGGNMVTAPAPSTY